MKYFTGQNMFNIILLDYSPFSVGKQILNLTESVRAKNTTTPQIKFDNEAIGSSRTNILIKEINKT